MRTSDRTSSTTILRLALLLVACLAACTTDPDTPRARAPGDRGGRADWVWQAVDGARCADGSPTGIGVSASPYGFSRGLLVYFMGGGACWDYDTCYRDDIASHLDGYVGEDFEADIARFGDSGIFNRADPANPFRSDSFVLVPYCTGDAHTGLRVTDHRGRRTHHVGYANVTAVVARLREMFAAPARVVVAGGSAGGFGAGFHWSRFVEAFAPAPVSLIDDAGPPLRGPWLPEARERAWRDAWGLDEVLPRECLECRERLDALLDWQAARHPESRAAILSYQHDPSTAFYLGVSTDSVAAGLADLEQRVAGRTNVKLFVVAGREHTMLHKLDTAQDGVTLRQWLDAMLSGSPTWQTVAPRR